MAASSCLIEKTVCRTDRTILSKYALSGEPGAEKSPLQTQSFYKQHAIERRTAVVNRIDITSGMMVCADGSAFHYDAILLATGGCAEAAEPSGFRPRKRFSSCAAGVMPTPFLPRPNAVSASWSWAPASSAWRSPPACESEAWRLRLWVQESAPFETQFGAKIGAAFVSLHQTTGRNLPSRTPD